MKENDSKNKTPIAMNFIGEFILNLAKKSVLDNWLKFFEILPFFLIIWILYQFTNLASIDKLVFFSWSQVINDTIALFFPVLFWIIGFSIANIVDPHDSHKNFFIRLFASAFVFAVVLLILVWINISYLIYEPIIAGYGINLMASIFVYLQVLTWSKKMKSKWMAFMLKIVAWMFILFFSFSHFKDAQYKNIYTKIEGKNEHVLYMNDKYIFTENMVIHNRDDSIFNYAK